MCVHVGIMATAPCVPPVNALTLEEVHARENIPVHHHPPPPPSRSGQGAADGSSTPGEGMQAFNKLLAVLESKQKNVCMAFTRHSMHCVVLVCRSLLLRNMLPLHLKSSTLGSMHLKVQGSRDQRSLL